MARDPIHPALDAEPVPDLDGPLPRRRRRRRVVREAKAAGKDDIEGGGKRPGSRPSPKPPAPGAFDPD
jgi:hypothetical protein